MPIRGRRLAPRERKHVRRSIDDHGCGDVRRLPALRRSLRKDVRSAMLFDYLLGGLVSLAILIYLVYALVRPEKF
jgi:K+-transporting ATPase KdpF subunit